MATSVAAQAAADRRQEWQLRDDCRKGNKAGVAAAIAKRVNLNAADDQGQTPLWIACFYGHHELVGLLLAANARTDVGSSNNQYTPLWVACQEGHAAVVKLLAAAGADINAPSGPDAASPVYIAAEQNNTAVVAVLVAANARLDLRTAYGTTPLWIACQNGFVEVVAEIIKGKPNLDFREAQSGATALYFASQKGFHKIVKILLRSGANPNLITHDGASSLYIASQNNHLEVVRYLLQFNADIHVKYKNTSTPLLIAEQRGNKEIVELLQHAEAKKSSSGDLPLPEPRGVSSNPVIASRQSPRVLRVGTAVLVNSNAVLVNSADSTAPKQQLAAAKPPAKTPPTSPRGALAHGPAANPKAPSSAPIPIVSPPTSPRNIPLPNNLSRPQTAASSAPAAPTSPLASPAPPQPSFAPMDSKHFAKVFVKYNGDNRRLSDVKANSLDEFLKQIRGQLHIPEAEKLKVEVYDNDAEEFFLLDRFSVFKESNSVTKLRIVQPTAATVASAAAEEAGQSRAEEVDEVVALRAPQSSSLPVITGAHIPGPRFGSPMSMRPNSSRPFLNVGAASSSPRNSGMGRPRGSAFVPGTSPAERPTMAQPLAPRLTVNLQPKRAPSPTKPRVALLGNHRGSSQVVDTQGDYALEEFDVGDIMIGYDKFISYTELEFISKIGSGTFGDVFLGRWQGAKVAIKISKAITTKEQDDFLNEINVMSQLRPHPHIVSLLGVCTDGEYPSLVMEYCDGGTLEKFIQTYLDSLKDMDFIKIALDIALGMKYLHKSLIIHRDLALRNILLVGASSPTATPLCKISDMGLAREWRADRSHTDANSGLPIRWMAPESLHTKVYNKTTDVWSFGCIISEMLTGKVPFHTIGDLDVGIAIRDTNVVPDLPAHKTPAILATVSRMCTHRDPNKRPTFDLICDLLQSDINK